MGVTMVASACEDDLVQTTEGWRFARRELAARALGKAELFTSRSTIRRCGRRSDRGWTLPASTGVRDPLIHHTE